VLVLVLVLWDMETAMMTVIEEGESPGLILENRRRAF
jgi:hypothetical protein